MEIWWNVMKPKGIRITYRHDTSHYVVQCWHQNESTLVNSSSTNSICKALTENILDCNRNVKKIQVSAKGFAGESGNFNQTHAKKNTPLNLG